MEAVRREEKNVSLITPFGRGGRKANVHMRIILHDRANGNT